MRLAISSLALTVLLAACSPAPSPGPSGPIGLESPTPSPAPTLVLLPTVPPLPTPGPSPSPRADLLVVANTDGSGVQLRQSPGDGEPLKVIPEGAEVISLGETQQAANRLWTRIRDAEGQTGWVASEFLVDPATAAVNPTAAPTPRPEVEPTPAGPTATFPPLRPTFTPQPSEPAPAAKPTAPAQVSPAPQPTAVAQPKPAATQAAPSKPAGQPPAAQGADRSAPQGGQCPGGQPIKASSATGQYYMPGSPGYASAQPDDCFLHEQAAQSAGYSRGQ